MRRICVFCGSKVGTNPIFSEHARELGRLLVASDIGLVFGGGDVGLMGIIASTVLDAGGDVIGILPRGLASEEIVHPRVQDMRLVDSMHERKAIMSDLSDAFIALPGGLGTLEELFEVLTWAQLGIHRKPTGLLNSGGFFDPLLAALEHTIDSGFIKERNRDLYVVESTPESMLERLMGHEMPPVRRWLTTEQT